MLDRVFRHADAFLLILGGVFVLGWFMGMPWYVGAVGSGFLGSGLRGFRVMFLFQLSDDTGESMLIGPYRVRAERLD